MIKGGIALVAWMVEALVITIILLAVISTSGQRLDWFLAMERTTALTGGVTPIFLAVAYLAWATCRTRRKHLITSYAAENLGKTEATENDPVPVEAMKSIQAWIDDRFRGRWLPRPADSIAIGGLILFGLGMAFHVGFGPVSLEGRPFDYGYGLAFGLMFSVLAYDLARLATSWSDIRRLLRVASRLPMVRVFDRRSPRISAWFFETTRSGELRRRAILKQVEALRGSTSVLRATWGAADHPSEWLLSEGDFTGFTDQLTKRYTGKNTGGKLLDNLLAMLKTHWAGIPVAKIHSSPSRDAEADEAVAASVAPQLREEIAGLLKASKLPSDAAVVDAKLGLLRDWVEMAEDLVALHIVRWLGAAMAQVWTMIGFLVIGSVCLLLAVTSYPFPRQGRLMDAVGLLIAGVVAVVLSVVIGTNTDEVLSRVKNTRPGLTPDATMLGHLATFVVPLLGVLAAVSFDMSDLLRSWLDPIFRIFM